MLIPKHLIVFPKSVYRTLKFTRLYMMVKVFFLWKIYFNSIIVFLQIYLQEVFCNFSTVSKLVFNSFMTEALSYIICNGNHWTGFNMIRTCMIKLWAKIFAKKRHFKVSRFKSKYQTTDLNFVNLLGKLKRANILLLKSNNRNTRKRCEICSS